MCLHQSYTSTICELWLCFKCANNLRCDPKGTCFTDKQTTIHIFRVLVPCFYLWNRPMFVLVIYNYADSNILSKLNYFQVAISSDIQNIVKCFAMVKISWGEMKYFPLFFSNPMATLDKYLVTFSIKQHWYVLWSQTRNVARSISG